MNHSNSVAHSERLSTAASTLYEARRTRQAIASISQSHQIADIDQAYAVAEINTRKRVNEGARIVGLKIGLTSKAVQHQLGVDQPDFGVLFDDMEFLNGQDVSAERLLQPKVEAELAFVMGGDLPNRVPSYGEFLSSLAYVLPAIEIVDSAIADWKITLLDTIADNASCGVYVLGDDPVRLGRFQLNELCMTLRKNGAVESVGTSAACLGHPLRAAYWLACTMAQRSQAIKSGQVILSGALGPMVSVVKGDRIDVRIGSIGSVSCRMA